MRVISKTALVLLTGIICANSTRAQFFDTSKAEDFFRLGVRLGMNMSNVSAGGPNFDWNHDSWGTGFEGGVVADIMIREWFGIQPGLFYQSRSNNYTHILGSGTSQIVNAGHTLYYSFYVPVLFEAKFNVTERLRWSLEAGPYLSFGVGHNDNGVRIVPTPEEPYNHDYFDNHKKNQMGLKIGTGLELDSHYYLGIHYMGGFGNAWKAEKVNYSGHNKAWTFTLGYSF